MSGKPDVSREGAMEKPRQPEMLKLLDEEIATAEKWSNFYRDEGEDGPMLAYGRRQDVFQAIRSHLSTTERRESKKMLKDFEHIEGIYRDYLIHEGMKPHEIGFRLKDLFDPIHSVLAHLSTPPRVTMEEIINAVIVGIYEVDANVEILYRTTLIESISKMLTEAGVEVKEFK